MRRVNIRDMVLLALFLLICLIVLLSVVQSVSDVISIYNQGNQYYSGSSYGYNSYASSSVIVMLLLSQGLAMFLGLLVILIIVYLVERLIKHRWPRTQPGLISLLALLILLSSEMNFLLAFLAVLAIPVTIFIELLVRHYGESVKRLSKSEFEKNLLPMPLDTGLLNKLNENFTTQQRNVVAYSGYAPFAGAGYYLGGWSFVVDTTKGAQSDPLESKRDKPLPFTLSQLYATVKKALEGQGLNDVLEVEEKLYVNGQRLRENPPFFNVSVLRPVPSVNQELVEWFRERPTEDVRYYQCIRFNSWRGEVIFTAFLRFVRRGKNLFAEIDYLLLPPLMRDYYWVDNRQSVSVASKVWELVKRSFDSPVAFCFGVPGRLLRSASYQHQQRKLAEVARNNPSFDYGAATSLRQFASDDEYHLFFQQLDKEMYLKIAEQELLEAIIGFLDEHHIDTTELRERQQTILNNGTIVKAENIGTLQTGDRARATTNMNVSRPAGTVASTAGRTAGAAKS